VLHALPTSSSLILLFWLYLENRERRNTFPVKYELNFYILFRTNSEFKGLSESHNPSELWQAKQASVHCI
jgi:hypothetical protein